MIKFTVPVATPSVSNQRIHWRKRHAQTKLQRGVTAMAWRAAELKAPPLPVVVSLTRVSPRTLDDDNLRGSLKAVRDEIAKVLSVDDGDTKRIAFAYDQRKPPTPRTTFVEVEIRSLRGGK